MLDDRRLLTTWKISTSDRRTICNKATQDNRDSSPTFKDGWDDDDKMMRTNEKFDGFM